MIEEYSNIVAKYIDQDDLEGLAESFRLRYSVYCEEKHFIDSADIPDPRRIETDEYDIDRSWHFNVLDTRANGDEHVIGTVRLVRYSDDMGFPTGKYHPALYDKLAGFDKSSIAEISRLCINQCYRKRRDDGLYGVESYSQDGSAQRRRYPIVMLALLREMYRFSKQAGIKYWLSSMEDTLYRYLKCISLEFQPLDDDYIEYYGKVKSFLMGIEDAERKLAEKRDDLYLYFMGTAVSNAHSTTIQ